MIMADKAKLSRTVCAAVLQLAHNCASVFGTDAPLCQCGIVITTIWVPLCRTGGAEQAHKPWVCDDYNIGEGPIVQIVRKMVRSSGLSSPGLLL